jgi:hypothetical protein
MGYISYGVKTAWTNYIELDATRAGEEIGYYTIDFCDKFVVVSGVKEKPGDDTIVALRLPNAGSFEADVPFNDNGHDVTIYISGVVGSHVYASLRIAE